MLETLFWILVGALIGWTVPQPLWARLLLNKLRTVWTSLTVKSDN